MNFLTAAETIYSRFFSEWTAFSTAGRVVVDSDPYIGSKTDPWVRITVRHSTGRQHTLGQVGSRRYRRTGLIYVQIFTPAQEATSEAVTLANEALTIFEGVTFSGIAGNDGLVRQIGVDGDWYQTRAEVRFFYDEVK